MFNMDTLSVLRQPVATEMAEYQALFQAALATDDAYLGQALAYVGRRSGKMMRPLLVLLMAKEFGRVGQKALYSAVSLELLHTASLVHDDVVDDSAERRGQRSVNAVYDNKVAVLVGDYLLSVCLLHSALTSDHRIVEIIARLGATLSKGEIDQLAHARGEAISEEIYFHIIQHKTASLFAALCRTRCAFGECNRRTSGQCTPFWRNNRHLFPNSRRHFRLFPQFRHWQTHL